MNALSALFDGLRTPSKRLADHHDQFSETRAELERQIRLGVMDDWVTWRERITRVDDRFWGDMERRIRPLEWRRYHRAQMTVLPDYGAQWRPEMLAVLESRLQLVAHLQNQERTRHKHR